MLRFESTLYVKYAHQRFVTSTRKITQRNAFPKTM